MTLILAVVTPALVALCADRRITTVGAQNVVMSQQDLDSKCVVLGNHSLAGFSGTATLDGLKMEYWITNALKEIPQRDQIRTLAERLTEMRRRAKNPAQVVLGFRGVGYRRVGGKIVAQAWLVSNAINDENEYDPAWADSKFEVRWTQIEPGTTRLFALGERVDPGIFDMAERSISMCAEQSPGNAKMIFDNLDTLNSITAHASSGRVGTAVQMSAMRRTTFNYASTHTMRIGAPGLRDSLVEYQYRNHGAKSSDPFAYYMPPFIDETFGLSGAFWSPTADPTKVPAERAPKFETPKAS